MLARALQHCVERSGVPSGVLCDVAQDLQRCIVPLMCLEGDDILEASLPRATDNKLRMSLTLAEEAALLGDDPAPQRAWAIITCPSDCPEETPKPEGTSKLERTVADLQGMQMQPLPPPPGFKLPMSGPPQLKTREPQVRIPRKSQLDLTSMASMWMAIVRNESTGKFECWYKTRVVGSLHLASLIPWACLRVTKKSPNCKLSIKSTQN